MKNLIYFLSIFVVMFSMTNKADAQWVDVSEYSSFNFIAPSGWSDQTREVLFPVGKVTSYEHASTVTIDVSQFYNFAVIDTLSGDVEFELDINSYVTEGAQLFVWVWGGATSDTLTFDNYFYRSSVAGVADTLIVPANTNKTIHGVYDGNYFIKISDD